MEVALVTFVGAGLTTLSAGFGITVPFGAVASGYELVRFLAGQDNPRTKQLVMEIVAGIWQDWRASGLPSDIAARHVEALPHILDHLRLPDEILVGSIAAAALDLKTGGNTAFHHGRRVAAELVAGARDRGVLAEHDLSEPISFFFLERLFGRLLHERQFMDSLLPSLDAYFHSAQWNVALTTDAGITGDTAQVGASRAQSSAATAQSAETSGLPAADLLASSKSLAMSKPIVPSAADGVDEEHPGEPIADEPTIPAPTERLLDAEDCAEVARRILAIEGLQQLAGQLRLTAAEAIRSGDVSFCDRLLGEAEGHDLKAAQADIAHVRGHLTAAGDTRLARAYIEELRGNGRRAARHYKAAIRCLSTRDVEKRLHLLELQALALMRHGQQHDDTGALEEALASCSEAADLVSRSANVHDWANWQLTTASLLVSLGKHRDGIQRYEAAAQHAANAAEVWLKTHDHAQWAEAQLIRAHALLARGDELKSVTVLREAEQIYGTALGVFARDRTPDQWVAASAGLGQTLVRLGELGNGAACLTGGVQHIASAIDIADRLGIVIDRTSLENARGNALLGLFAELDGEHLAADAIEAFKRALEACDRARYTRQALAIRHRLGMAMWAFGSKRQSTDILGAAAEELLSTLDEAERIDDTARAEDVRDDLRQLYEELGAADAEQTVHLRQIA
jgi:tetratricopeptide (TPR) repeat protein